MNSVLQLIRSDYDRYNVTGEGKAHPLAIILLTQGLWAPAILLRSLKFSNYEATYERFEQEFFQ